MLMRLVGIAVVSRPRFASRVVWALFFSAFMTSPIHADGLMQVFLLADAPDNVVVIDARSMDSCRRASIQAALCLPLERVLHRKGRPANIRDIRWMMGTYGLTGREHVAVYSADPARRDALAAIFFLIGQSQVSRVDSQSDTVFAAPGDTGSMSRRDLFVAPVRMAYLLSVRRGQLTVTDLVTFTKKLEQAESAQVRWPASYL
jgi:thiosulfate/3-mercaptopyruvate sulfurtransferase